MASRADIAILVLQHLGVLAAGEDATAEDMNYLTEAISDVLEELRTKGMEPFADYPIDTIGEVNIPRKAKMALRDVVAHRVGPSYGVNGQSLVLLSQSADLGLVTLREQYASKMQGEPIKADYF